MFSCQTVRFASAPVNAQGGKQFNDPVSSSQPYQARSEDGPPNPFSHPSDAPAGAPQYETAEQEKARLQQQYASAPGAATGASSSLPARVEALYDFEGQEQGDLSFRVGDIIEVNGQEDEMWWRGSLAGRAGIFPSTYTRPL